MALRARRQKKTQKQGLFWLLPQEVQDAIIQSAIEDAPDQRKRNTEELEAQCKAKEQKEQLVRELNLHNATEAYIDAIYYYKMYHSPVSCSILRSVYNLITFHFLSYIFLGLSKEHEQK